MVKNQQQDDIVEIVASNDEEVSHLVLLTKEVLEALEEKNFDFIDQTFKDIHAADIADIFEQLNSDKRHELAEHMAQDFDAEILTHLDKTIKSQILEIIDPKKIAKSIAGLDIDDAIELVEDLKETEQEEIIENLPFASKQLVEEGLTFPEDSAGRLMQRNYVAAPDFWTVKEVLDYLRETKDKIPDDFYNVFIVDPLHRVIGYIPLSQLLRANDQKKLKALTMLTAQTIPFDKDQEDVAYIFRHYNLISAPVVDEAQRLIGVITVDDIVEVIEEEAEEDIFNLAGVRESDFHASTITTAFTRIRWLLVLLVNTFLASIVINYFKGTIDQLVVLAVLMPIVTSMGGNAGIQVVTVAVRALATKDIRPSNIRRVILKELSIAAINGLVFAIIAGTIVTLWFHDYLVALVLAASMVLNLLWAGIGGILIPLILARFKIDPAVSAGPILATSTDVFGFCIFLGLATLVLL